MFNNTRPRHGRLGEKNMELRQIKAFTTLADTLNFTRASEVLFVTQPTLSKQISALERELGIKLLVRDTHNVLLTEKGTAFLNEARAIVADVERALEVARGEVKNKSNVRLVIGFDERLSLTPSTTGAYMKLFQAFHKEYVNVDVSICKDNYAGIVHALKKDDIDIAFILHEGLMDKSYFDTHLDGLFNRKLIYHDEMLFLLPYREAVDYVGEKLSELVGLFPTAYLSRHHASFSIAGEVFREIGAFPFIQFCDDWTDILMRVSKGEGFTFCPAEQYHLMHISDVIGLPLAGRDFCAYVVAHWAKQNPNPYIDAFMQCPPKTDLIK